MERLLGFDLLADKTRGRIIIRGDSNLVIRQMRGEIDRKAPVLQFLRHKAMEKLRSWPIHEFLHMKRDWSQSSSRLESKALQQEQSKIALYDQDRQKFKLVEPVGRIVNAQKCRSSRENSCSH